MYLYLYCVDYCWIMELILYNCNKFARVYSTFRPSFCLDCLWVLGCWISFSIVLRFLWNLLDVFLKSISQIGLDITIAYIDGLVQDCCISIANALEILQSCTKPSIFLWGQFLPLCQWMCHWNIFGHIWYPDGLGRVYSDGPAIRFSVYVC